MNKRPDMKYLKKTKFMWSTNSKSTTSSHRPNKMCRSSLTLSAAIETKKYWDASFLFSRDELLHIAALSANGRRCGSNGGSKVNKIFTWWNSQDLSTRLPVMKHEHNRLHACYGKSFFCVAKDKRTILHLSAQARLRKIYKINQRK